MKQNVTQIFSTPKFGTYNLITLTWQKYYLKNTHLINLTLFLVFSERLSPSKVQSRLCDHA